MSSLKQDSKVPREYATFLAALELFSIALARSTVRVDREEYLKDEETNVNFKLFSKPIEIGETHFDVCSTLRLKISTEKSKKLQLWLATTYELHFHSASTLDAKFIKQFCDSEIRLVVWPYFREFVSNMTGRMHIPPFVLPLSQDEWSK